MSIRSFAGVNSDESQSIFFSIKFFIMRFVIMKSQNSAAGQRDPCANRCRHHVEIAHIHCRQAAASCESHWQACRRPWPSMCARARSRVLALDYRSRLLALHYATVVAFMSAALRPFRKIFGMDPELHVRP